MFDSLTDLQSSQTSGRFLINFCRFDSLTDLQSSQTLYWLYLLIFCLIPLLIYKALKHARDHRRAGGSLIPLLIYKALKRTRQQQVPELRLIPLLIYKALKHLHG